MSLKFCVLTFFLFTPLVAVIADAGNEYESECSKPSTTTIFPVVPVAPVNSSFRTDNLTRAECLDYLALSDNGATICRIFALQEDCNDYPETRIQTRQVRKGSKDKFRKDKDSVHPTSRTYITASCPTSDRAAVSQLTTSISAISPERAVILTLHERTDAHDQVHYDVINPVRYQVIELVHINCATPTITSKLYNVGTLPSLVTLKFQLCRNLVIHKSDFSRMQQVQWISFFLSTIAALEPYTFTDLPLLKTLLLENGLGAELYMLSEEADPRWRTNPSPLSYADFDTVRRLHCDCSFVWLRNFLTRHPFLMADKRSGEFAIIGNYMSPWVNTDAVWPVGLSVDCARNLTYASARVGPLFSYNTSCYTPCYHS
ncbi:uncharacterized protein LOC129598865 [Paramacrobiotus metropolitanus]|uniref:uncharacterized protein LOC129598865 n=1 Tax=Paramacrobiotus metropolitanus TaxID=2943436 RepID=UPI0024462088|nr:uncharacterized protein LOC129598865 [Paramacrobiotus metropolitanus]